MKTIAHKIENISQSRKALASGVDFLEIDVAKEILFSKFTTQHHGIKGKLGIGESLEPILAAIPQDKLLLDIKHASSSLTFAKKFSDLLTRHSIKKARICGRDWEIISRICQKTGCMPFYTLAKVNDFKKLKKKLPKLTQPEGFSVNHMLIDKNLMRNLSASRQIWAWTVNDSKEADRLAKLKVDGIITNEWETIK